MYKQNVFNFYFNGSDDMDINWKEIERKLKEIWRRLVNKEMKENNWIWGYVQRLIQNRVVWRFLV